MLVPPEHLRAQLTNDDRAALGDLAPQFAQAFPLVRGWYRAQPIRYYDFGPQAPTISPMFLVARGFSAAGRPVLVEGQRPIFSSVPGLPGYSAIWQVQYLVVGPDYVANTLSDGRTAIAWTLAGRARLVVPGLFVNCPIVPLGSTLEGDPGRRALQLAWYKGHDVWFFDFGRTAPEPAPIYAFVSGFDGAAPRFIRGQANVVDVVPEGDGRQRDLWDVTFVAVPAAYEPDGVRDAASVATGSAPRGPFRLTRAGSVRNCPVVLVTDATAPRPGLLDGSPPPR